MTSTETREEITNQQDKTVITNGKDAAVIEDQNDSADNSSSTAINQPLFRAVGIIRGEVKFNDDEKNPLTVTISNKEYRLFYNKRNPNALSGLKKVIEKTGETTQRLIVYPKVTHFPKRDQPHQIGFQLIGFDQGRYETGISQVLGDNEFKLCGLWQFIPVCRPPCISIFLNFKQERLEFLKASDDPATQAKFMKASHIPVLWKDSPVRPFRFNPKGGKDQGHPFFVQIKAAFLPHRDAFGFVEQLEEPIEQAPKFMKLPKSVKGQVRKNSSLQQKKNSHQKPKPNLTNKIIPQR